MEEAPSSVDSTQPTARSLSPRRSLNYGSGAFPTLAGDMHNWMEPPGSAPTEMETSLLKDAQSMELEDALACAPPTLSHRTLSRRLSLFSEPSASVPDEDVHPELGRLEVYWPAIRMEFQRMCSMAIPLLINNVANFAVTIIVLAYTGHLGKHALACATLGGSLFNVLGQSLFIGCAATLETLCGQAVGAGKYKLLGLEMARCMALMTIAMPIFALLYQFMRPLLLAVGQDAAVAEGAAAYLIRLTPALWLMGMTECLKRTLTAQGIVLPNMLIAIFTTTCTPAIAWFYITYCGFGFLGAAHAVTTGYACNLICFAVTFVGVNSRAKGTTEEMWPGWRWDMLQGFGVILRIAFPTTMMICLDWWTWETMILLSGLLPEPDVSVAVMGLGFNVVALCFMVPLAVVSASAIGIANFLGANQPKRARLAHYMGVALTCSIMSAVCAVIYTFRHQIGAVYTNEAKVLAALDAAMPIICIILWCDGFQMINTGPLRGSGRQAVGATINLTVLWGFGVPLAATLGFSFRLGVQGFWYALLAAFALQAVIMCVTVSCVVDLDKEARKAQLRMTERAGGVATHAPTSVNASPSGVEEPLLLSEERMD